MLTAIEGYIENNQIIVHDNLAPYEGQQFVLTFLNTRHSSAEKKKLDFSKFGERTERGQNVDDYMREMRENDRV